MVARGFCLRTFVTNDQRQRTMDYDLYTDEQIVNGILQGDRLLTEYFFYRKCSGLLTYILLNVFDGNIDHRELVSELYLFVAYNDWQVLRNFQYRSTLMTYISVVAMRFFQKKRAELIDSTPFQTLNEKMWMEHRSHVDTEKRMDIISAMHKMTNERYRYVIEKLDLQDVRPELLAEEMNVTVDNLYNIHRRALLQLRLVMGRKEEYV